MRKDELPSEPTPLGDGVDPPEGFIGGEYRNQVPDEPIPLCSVCKEKTVCWLTETSTGKILEMFDKCRGCFLGFYPKKEI